MKAPTVPKWAIGVIALLAVAALAGVVWLFVAFYLDMEKGEQHRRQLQAELDSGRWDFGDQPALFAVAPGYREKRSGDHPYCGKGRIGFAGTRTRRRDTARLCCQTIVATPGSSRRR